MILCYHYKCLFSLKKKMLKDGGNILDTQKFEIKGFHCIYGIFIFQLMGVTTRQLGTVLIEETRT